MINAGYFDNVVNMVNNIIKCNQFPSFLRSTNQFSFYNFHTNNATVFTNGAQTIITQIAFTWAYGLYPIVRNNYRLR